MAPVTVTELFERNQKLAVDHEPFPTFPEMAELGISVPKICIVSCADPRIVPEKIFQLNGDAVVMRNMAGHPQTAMKDIVALDAFIGFTDLVIVHHTDCGSTYFKDDLVHGELKKRLPEDEYKEIDTMSFGTIAIDLGQSVKDDMDYVKSAPLIRKELAEHTHGYLYDIKTGALKEIK